MRSMGVQGREVPSAERTGALCAEYSAHSHIGTPVTEASERTLCGALREL